MIKKNPFENLKIKGVQILILKTIEKSPCSASFLSKKIGFSDKYIISNTTKLKEKNLIQEKKSIEDSRKKILILTEDGILKLKKIEQKQKFMQNITEKIKENYKKVDKILGESLKEAGLYPLIN